MADNFSITFMKVGKNINLKLTGDFDGSSALELIYSMNNCLNTHDIVFINTDYLILIEPFGVNVFRYNLGMLSKHSGHFLFTGNKAGIFKECWPNHARPEVNINKTLDSFSNNCIFNH